VLICIRNQRTRRDIPASVLGVLLLLINLKITQKINTDFCNEVWETWRARPLIHAKKLTKRKSDSNIDEVKTTGVSILADKTKPA
jgi:hypothetical protein